MAGSKKTTTNDETAPAPPPESAPTPSPSPAPEPSPSPASASVDTSALSTQIVQAVDKTNAVVMGATQTEAVGIAFQKVAQATSYAIQDSTDYMRNIMTMAAATQGICLEKMLAEQSPDPWAKIMEEAQKAVTAAQKNMAEVGTTAGTIVTTSYPSS